MKTDILKADGSCWLCAGTGWERSEEGRMRHCRCLDAGRMERLMADARIPKRYEHCDLDSYMPNDPTQKKAKLDVSRFLDKFPLIDIGLLFMGACGVGKTHLAVSLLKEVIVNKGGSGLFYDFRDLLREIQGSYNSVSQ